MKLFLLIILFLDAGCGALLEPIHDDPRFTSVKEQFVKDAKKFGINADISNIKISFGDVYKSIKYAGFIPISKAPDDAEAYCLVFQQSNNDLIKPISKLALGNKYKLKVIIVSDSLKNESAEYLESIVYHELGHCSLNLKHLENEVIMNSCGVYRLDEFRYFYLKELFTRSPSGNNTIYHTNNSDILSDHDLRLIYQVDYIAFGNRIFQQLFFNQATEEYIFNQTPPT